MNDYSKETVINSVKLLPDQILSAWESVSALPLPEQYLEAKHVVVAGMGGSALGGRILKSYAKLSLPIPIEIVDHYDLPAYVDENTLVIASSYSGNTEEVISAYKEALERKSMLFVITTGGKLSQMAQSEGVAAYIFDPEHNPSLQPRMASGYCLGAILSLMSKTRLLHLEDTEIKIAISVMRDYIKKFEEDNESNPALLLANGIYTNIPVLVSSEHLNGATHLFKNQLNESAKSFSIMFDIPESNHHLMEGLVNPKANNDLLFILLNSKLYNERVQLRYQITSEVLSKNNIKFLDYSLTSETRLAQVFELMALGSWVQIYLSQKYGSDLIAVPWVDYFKEKLAK